MGEVKPAFVIACKLPKHIDVMSHYASWTYLVRVGYRPGVKIGFTGKRLKIRLHRLSKEHQSPIECLDAFNNPTPFYVEQALHAHFAHKHLRGEFYDLTQDDLASVPALVRRFCRQAREVVG